MPLDNFSVSTEDETVASIMAATILTGLNTYASTEAKAAAFKLLYAAVRQAVATS